MLASFLRRCSSIKRKCKRRSNPTTPVVEVATIQVPPPPGIDSRNTVFAEAIIDDIIEENQDGESNNRGSSWRMYLDNYILFTYYIAYNLAISLNTPEASQRGYWTHLTFFWIISACSVLDILQTFKFMYLLNPVEHVIKLGYFLNVILVRSSWTFVSFKRRNEIKELLKLLNDGRKYFPKSHNRRMVCSSMGLILGSSVLQCLVRIIKYDLAWKEWTFADAVCSRAFDVGHMTMVWSSGKEANKTETLIESFSEDVNFITALLALISLAMETGGLTHAHIYMAILLSIALYIKSLIEEFCAELKEPTSVVDGKIKLTVWQMYQHLKSFSKMCNAIYEAPVSFLQVETFMLGAFFVDNCLDFWENAGVIMFLVTIMAKHVVFYVCLAISSIANEAFREWVLEHFSDETRVEIENGPRMTFQALMEDLNSKPIGIKSNSSLINKAFIVQLIGTVVAIFLLLLDKRKENAN